jgi:hypothetical protein
MLGAILLSVTLACQSRTAADSGELRVVLQPAEGAARPARIELAGLSDDEVSALRSRGLDEAMWASLLRVSVADQTDANLPAVAGHYAITGGSVTFTPLYPFDPGRAYRVRVDPSKLLTAVASAKAVGPPRSTEILTSIVKLPAAATKPAADVAAIYPSVAVVPENLLRMYVEFSAPMGSRKAGEFVRLLDRTSGSDTVVEEAFLPVEADFWSPDHRRYTLFLDPGRVKRGILPNRERGRPLRAGHAYALAIAAEWPDENGQPLKAAFRHEFTAGPAIASGIDASAWRITPPTPGTRDRLVVEFDRALDHAVVARALGVERDGIAVDGAGSVEAGDTRWVFVPRAAWPPGVYRLTAQPFLEDPQGNQIDRAFEVVVDTPREPNPEPYRIPFVIGPNAVRTQSEQRTQRRTHGGGSVELLCVLCFLCVLRQNV